MAVSTLGVKREKEFFLQGYNEMLRRIDPKAVICYSSPFDEMKGNIIVVDYAETNNLKSYENESKSIYNTIPEVYNGYIKWMSGHIIAAGMGSGGGGYQSKRDELLNKASKEKLKNAINEMYRPNAKVGDGGLADAIRYEKSTHCLVGGKSHIQKGRERLKNLENIMQKQKLSQVERKMVQELADDLRNALEGTK